MPVVAAASLPRVASPALADGLRVFLWQRSQARLRAQYGFDLSATDALDRARQLAEGAPANAEYAVVHAAALATRGDLLGARAEAQRAVELNAHSARAHTTLATILMQLGEKDDALHHAQRAAELDANDVHVLYNVGLAEHAAGNMSAAQQALRRAWIVLYEQAGPPDDLPRVPWWWLRGRPRRHQ